MQRILLLNFHNTQICGLHCGKTNHLNKVRIQLLHKAISKAFVSSKKMQDSLEVWIPRRGIRIPDTGFRILCKWKSFEGFRIPPAKISQIPESGFPQTGQHFG